MAVTKVSSQFSVNWHDIKKGLLTAAFTPIFSIIIPLLQQGVFTFNWKQILGTAIAGGMSYVSLMFFTPAKIYVKDATDTEIKNVKEGTAEVKLIKT